MKKVLVIGPVLTRSGYGEHARFVVDSLLSKPSEYDVFVIPINWGNSSWSYDHEYKRQVYEHLIKKREAYSGEYDLSIQVTVPTEFQAIAPYNIGVTAGVETTTVPPEWIPMCNAMDKIIVTSEFTKESFLNTTLELDANFTDEKKTFKGSYRPFEVVSYPINDKEPEDISDKLSCVTTPFNFLCISQLAPRKNTEQLLECFVEAFRDNKDVGLILKCHAQNHSRVDKDLTEKMLYPAIRRLGERECKIYHVHGELKDSEILGLINNEKTHAYYTTTYAEGFGLPLFDAASQGMPIVAPKFSGYLDFLHIPHVSGTNKKEKRYMFEPIKVEIGEVPEHCLMDNIITKGSKWGIPDRKKTIKALKETYNNFVAKQKRAQILKEYVCENFSREKQLEKMCEAIRTGYENEQSAWAEDMNETQVL